MTLLLAEGSGGSPGLASAEDSGGSPELPSGKSFCRLRCSWFGALPKLRSLFVVIYISRVLGSGTLLLKLPVNSLVGLAWVPVLRALVLAVTCETLLLVLFENDLTVSVLFSECSAQGFV